MSKNKMEIIVGLLIKYTNHKIKFRKYVNNSSVQIYITDIDGIHYTTMRQFEAHRHIDRIVSEELDD